MSQVQIDDATLTHDKGGYTLEVAGVKIQVNLSRRPVLVIAEGHYLEVWTNSIYEVKRSHQYACDTQSGKGS